MMRPLGVVAGLPGEQRLAQLVGGLPIPQPDDLLLHRSDDPLGDGVPSRPPHRGEGVRQVPLLDERGTAGARVLRAVIGPVAYYGPNDQRAGKLVAGIIERKGEQPVAMQKWFSDTIDVREDLQIPEELGTFLEGAGVRTVVMADGIIGCPHERGRRRPRSTSFSQARIRVARNSPSDNDGRRTSARLWLRERV